ncbi:MAG: DUF3347 domain-containing protein [Chitinophagaceae bacterium]|nr:DUF3347 domain-containing protein [Chitinophagaceae bacterium]
MTRNILHLIILSIFISCTAPKEEKHDTEDIEIPVTPTPPKAETKNIALNALLGQYYQIAEALTSGDVNQVRIIANAIAAGAEKAGERNIIEAAKEIVGSNQLETERKSFQKLSNAFISMVKKEGLENGNLYVAYCPMAFNNQGASWITTVKAIKNPYFGESMLTCGSIKETIQ